MRSGLVHAVLGAVLATAATSAAIAGQSHAHPAVAKAQEAKPKPAPQTEKPNRPKPENQPGAVMDAEKLAASHADHHEMHSLEGGGVLPSGWHHRFDLPTMKLEHVRFMLHGDDMHITSGPPAVYYNPGMTASGGYVVSARFNQLTKGEHREGYGPFVGGADLDGKGQRYLYLLVRQDGRFLVKERVGANTRGLFDWTSHKAIQPFGADGRMSNELAIAVDAEHVRFLINGSEVARRPKGDLPTDGVVGLRINHQLDVLVQKLTVTPHGTK
jgi:hypothetical protein